MTKISTKVKVDGGKSDWVADAQTPKRGPPGKELKYFAVLIYEHFYSFIYSSRLALSTLGPKLPT